VVAVTFPLARHGAHRWLRNGRERALCNLQRVAIGRYHGEKRTLGDIALIANDPLEMPTKKKPQASYNIDVAPLRSRQYSLEMCGQGVRMTTPHKATTAQAADVDGNRVAGVIGGE